MAHAGWFHFVHSCRNTAVTFPSSTALSRRTYAVLHNGNSPVTHGCRPWAGAAVLRCVAKRRSVAGPRTDAMSGRSVAGAARVSLSSHVHRPLAPVTGGGRRDGRDRVEDGRRQRKSKVVRPASRDARVTNELPGDPLTPPGAGNAADPPPSATGDRVLSAMRADRSCCHRVWGGAPA